MIDYLIPILILISILIPFTRKISFSQSMVIFNFIIFFITTLTSPDFISWHSPLVKEFAFSTAYLSHPEKWYTLITSMFLHADVWHILLNMMGIIFIGFPFEHEIGREKFAFIYLSTGIFASLFYSLFVNGSLIGASGAIFGILAAFAAYAPMKRIVVPLLMPIMILVPLPVIIVALFYAVIESAYVAMGNMDGIAHVAHLGGFIGGVAFSFVLKLNRVPGEKKEVDLTPYLKTEREREIYRKALQAEQREVREAWISYLVENMRCPKCGGRVEIKNGKLYCRRCGYI